MNTIYTVLLSDGTVGTINSGTLNGQSAEVFIGENGNPIEVEGRLEDVLEEKTVY